MCALLDSAPEIDGFFYFFVKNNHVVVDWAAPSRGGNGTAEEGEECGVYMTNVKEDVEDQAVRDHFGKFGVIEKVKVGEQAFVLRQGASWGAGAMAFDQRADSSWRHVEAGVCKLINCIGPLFRRSCSPV